MGFVTDVNNIRYWEDIRSELELLVGIPKNKQISIKIGGSYNEILNNTTSKSLDEYEYNERALKILIKNKHTIKLGNTNSNTYYTESDLEESIIFERSATKFNNMTAKEIEQVKKMEEAVDKFSRIQNYKYIIHSIYADQIDFIGINLNQLTKEDLENILVKDTKQSIKLGELIEDIKVLGDKLGDSDIAYDTTIFKDILIIMNKYAIIFYHYEDIEEDLEIDLETFECQAMYYYLDAIDVMGRQ